jgi:hypothetical protein
MFAVQLCRIILCLLWTMALAEPDPAVAAEWQAGIARARITPTVPMPMAGYASRGAKPASATLNDLWAKVLVLQDDRGQRAVLVTFDLVGLDRDLSNRITTRLMREHQLSRQSIALCCSHTHSGPVVNRNLATMHYFLFDEEHRQLVDEYARSLEDAVVRAVGQALAGIKPSELAWGSGTATFAVNRRNNKEAEVPQRQAAGELRGPVDHDVPVLAVRQGGSLAAVVFGYACHCTTLAGFEWTGDYAGFAQAELEEQYPGAQAMFWAGCGGDQNPLPRRTVELARNYGHQLAEAVSSVLQQPLAPLSSRLTTSYREIDLPLAPPPTREALQTEAAGTNPYIRSRAEALLRGLDQGRPIPVRYPYPIAVWQLGGKICWIFLGGEVVVDYSLALKENLTQESQPRASIWCTAYSNDVMAYIPSRRVLLEGGYEGGGAMVYYGLPGPWAPEVEETILSATEEMARKSASP